MNKIFIDADVILDLLLHREPFFSATAELFSLIEYKEVQAFTTPVVLANIYYISSKIANKKSARDYIIKLLSIIRIASIDEKIMCLAANSTFKDFEDAIQYYAAQNESITFFVTRNKADYTVADITICTPDEYLQVYHQHSTN
ncbi:MAG: PIN domain-containing protein [Calditrichaeota bacterium]|nr:MAG: PIN domain-containing protein [Calditrichota bacterium]